MICPMNFNRATMAQASFLSLSYHVAGIESKSFVITVLNVPAVAFSPFSKLSCLPIFHAILWPLLQRHMIFWSLAAGLLVLPLLHGITKFIFHSEISLKCLDSLSENPEVTIGVLEAGQDLSTDPYVRSAGASLCIILRFCWRCDATLE